MRNLHFSHCPGYTKQIIGGFTDSLTKQDGLSVHCADFVWVKQGHNGQLLWLPKV